ncbi:hypothetical protein CDD81_7183 [Ophiocordyceps australis]|uniref:Alpha-1,3-glucosyltransferase n=1 Tax=Ophiocordyceps australis TaxID=1399860 RepID=A0A2C5Y122_9HYPO|nr:hypothetical protein CDD81_7183 [Ophiocordyceps australis]
MASASPSPHKARRKPKRPTTGTVKPAATPPDSLVRTPSFPLAAFLWPARTSSSQWEVLPLILMVVGLFKWAAGLWGYSGFQRPPMYGDYEAQRNWMEVTTQLPASMCYIMGKMGALIDPTWFQLYISRGSEDSTLKVFMRATVFVSEYLTFVPAVIVFVRRYSRLSGVSSWTSSVSLVAILMQPAVLLIDNVHFQYNTVMLGLVVASMASMLAERYNWAAVFFVAALGFKQMALYYAFSVFSYLLGICVFPKFNPSRLLSVAITTIISFAILLLPILIGTLYDRYHSIDSSLEMDETHSQFPLLPFLNGHLDNDSTVYALLRQVVQILHRVFPFSRGLFEDKVANFWCAANVIIKLRNLPQAVLQRASLLATLLSILPPNIMLLFRPRKTALSLAFATSAWGFFLFSYQVHEKSVLLPLMPMTLLLAGKQGLNGEIRAWVGFANLLGVWTMFPLLSRVDLRTPYAILTLLWAFLLGLPPTSWSAPFEGQAGQPLTLKYATALLHGFFYAVMGTWHVINALLLPPTSKPDLWVVVNVVIGAAGFLLCYLWCLWKLACECDLMPSITRSRIKSKTQ